MSTIWADERAGTDRRSLAASSSHWRAVAGLAPVGAGHRGEPGQAVFGVSGEPAVNAGAAYLAFGAFWGDPGARRQLPRQPAPLRRAQPGPAASEITR